MYGIGDSLTESCPLNPQASIILLILFWTNFGPNILLFLEVFGQAVPVFVYLCVFDAYHPALGHSCMVLNGSAM